MKLWLDDIRPMPDHFDVHVKTAEDAIALIRTRKVVMISLDHDLGEDKTGYDVAKAIEEMAYYSLIPELMWTVHSANPVGRTNIEISLTNADKYWTKHD